MRVLFYAPDGTGDKMLVAAVMGGARKHGDVVEYIIADEYAGPDPKADVAACYGVRASTRIILNQYRAIGKRVLMFDKGYWGRGTYTRVSVNAWHPTKYFMVGRSAERLTASGQQVCARVERPNGNVIYAATTQTWCDFHNLGPARAMDELIVRTLVQAHGNAVLYRPRPGYARKHPELCNPINGVGMSQWQIPLKDELKFARLLVTVGSNAAIEAAALGVPVWVLGDNPASLLNNEHDDSKRLAFFRDLAWCQWTLSEYLSGEAWEYIKRTLA